MSENIIRALATAIVESELNDIVIPNISKVNELVQESLTDEELTAVSRYVVDRATDIIAGKTIDVLESLVQEGVDISDDDVLEEVLETLDSYSMGVVETLVNEISMSPQLKEKIKKFLKYGAIGAGLAGAGAAAVAAATHPDQVKDMAQQVVDKAKDVAQTAADKVEDLKKLAMEKLKTLTNQATTTATK